MTRLLTTAIATMSLLSACGPAPESSVESPASPPDCAALASVSLADTRIASAATVPAGAYQPPEGSFEMFPTDYTQLPELCRVSGSIHPSADSDIRFELWLPTQGWNGRFMQTGNGGAAGSMMVFAMVEPLLRGYAVAHTDTGHRGGGGEFSWVAGHPERLVDFQYRAVHELTRVGTDLTTRYYGSAPASSVFMGCSTGGRQGLTEARYFPEDYDAIVAGAPANNWPALVSLSALTETKVAPGSDSIAVEKLGLLKEAAIAACDGNDGVADRVIARPESCAFDPDSLQCTDSETGDCLLPGEVAAARALYAGLVNGAGEVLYPGTGPGSETTWVAYASPGFRIGSSFYQYVVMNDPDWDPASLDVDRDLPRARAATGPELAADDPDLAAFFGRGGKLLMYHGTIDGLIPYGNSVQYHQDVVDTVGKAVADQQLRFYLVPGMDHCAGGEGAWAADWLGAMEHWLDSGSPPGELTAAHPAQAFGPPGTPPGKPFTRPLCPWPLAAVYRGQGDSDDAASFACAAQP